MLITCRRGYLLMIEMEGEKAWFIDWIVAWAEKWRAYKRSSCDVFRYPSSFLIHPTTASTAHYASVKFWDSAVDLPSVLTKSQSQARLTYFTNTKCFCCPRCHKMRYKATRRWVATFLWIQDIFSTCMPLLLLSLMIYSRQTDHARHRSKHLCLEVSFYFFLFYSFRHGVWHHCANPIFGDREAQSS